MRAGSPVPWRSDGDACRINVEVGLLFGERGTRISGALLEITVVFIVETSLCVEGRGKRHCCA